MTQTDLSESQRASPTQSMAEQIASLVACDLDVLALDLAPPS